jgi:hypothetical protein
MAEIDHSSGLGTIRVQSSTDAYRRAHKRAI